MEETFNTLIFMPISLQSIVFPSIQEKMQEQFLREKRKQFEAAGYSKARIDAFFAEKTKPTKLQSIERGFEGFLGGVGKSFVGAAKGAAKLTEKGARAILPQALEKPILGQFTGKTAAEQVIPEKAVTAETGAEKAGKFIGDVGQFFIPGTQVLKARKALEATKLVKGLPKMLQKALPAATTEAALGTGISAIQSGELGKKEAGIGAIAGAIPVVGGAASAALKGTGNKFQKAAEKLYQSVLKPSLSKKNIKKIPSIIRTGLDEAITLSKGGADKLKNKIDGFEKSLDEWIKKSSERGDKISTKNFQEFIDDAKELFTGGANVEAGQKASDDIQRLLDDFVEKYGDEIPVEAAQEIKIKTYQQLKRQYDELGSAVQEGTKALARGLKENIAGTADKVGDINKNLSKLYEFEQALDRSSARLKNLNVLGLGTKILAAGALGAKSGGLGLAAATGVASEVASHPWVKSLAAIGLDKLGKSLKKLSLSDQSNANTIIQRILVNSNKSKSQKAKEVEESLGKLFKGGAIPKTKKVENLKNKVLINKLIDIEGDKINETIKKISSGEFSKTSGPIDVVKVGDEFIVLDGQHRASEALIKGHKAINANEMSKEEAIKKYADRWPQLKNLLTDEGIKTPTGAEVEKVLDGNIPKTSAKITQPNSPALSKVVSSNKEKLDSIIDKLNKDKWKNKGPYLKGSFAEGKQFDIKDPYIGIVSQRGKFWGEADHSKNLGMPLGKCHENTAKAYLEGKGDIATGYAYSLDIGKWVRHSWIVKSGEPIETTTFYYQNYFGTVLNKNEANIFTKFPRPSTIPPGTEAYGAIAGVEKDEDGKIGYDPKKGALGMLGNKEK